VFPVPAREPPTMNFCGECGAASPSAAGVWRVERPDTEVLWRMRRVADVSVRSSPLRSPTRQAPRRENPHLQERLEGERKQVTVLFADLKGSMELMADRDLKRRKILDP